MKKFIILLCLILSFNISNAKKITANGVTTLFDVDSTFLFEKVYLHIDRPCYMSGENIWFKAYLVDAKTNMLINSSKNLHVEFISPDLKIIQSRLVHIEDGVGVGDFQISDSAISGRYMIRAYTNWMRNFNDLFFFSREITVASYSDDKTVFRSNALKHKPRFDIQFFPESGSLVDNILTKIGFKAVDSSGKGCDVKGLIKTASGKIITTFESSHLGMGAFTFTPYYYESYVAEVLSNNGETISIPLPEIFRTGLQLLVKETNDQEVLIAVKTNQKTLQLISDRIFTLRITSHNFESIDYELKISTLSKLFKIPTQNLQEGICRLTLFNDENIPQCERLVYIQKKHDLKLSIQTDKTEYSPRSPVNLTVTITDTLGNPKIATLSLSATDANLINSSIGSNSDIFTYLLLESEIKGFIEQPESYFNTDNPDRWKKLDLLLLTQGWRDFIWKYITLDNFIPKHKIESGISISGNLRRRLINKPIDKANITLTLFDDSSKYFCFTRTDSLGQFFFDSLYFGGDLKILVCAKADNNILQEQIVLNQDNYTSPDINNYYSTSNVGLLDEISPLKNEFNYQRLYKNKYHLYDTILLNELVFKKSIQKGQFNDKHKRIYDYADDVIKVTEQNYAYSDVFSLIKGTVNGLTINENYSEGFKNYQIKVGGDRVLNFEGRNYDSTPLFLLNGVPTSIEILIGIPIREIDKVEIVKRNLSIFGNRGFNGVISVYTKEGSDFLPAQFNPNAIKEKVTGYDVPRVFYAPKYNDKNLFSENPDFRTTIYWNPNIVANGQADEDISFFNADRATTIEVEVQGITQEGEPISGRIKYQVSGKISQNTK